MTTSYQGGRAWRAGRDLPEISGSQPEDAAPGARPGLAAPVWRRVLEARWQQRLRALTRLSLAYHDAAERGQRSVRRPEARQLRRLMRQAVAARRALSDTEDALARLAAGRFGRCEHCRVAIALQRLRAEPETRYCDGCAGPAGGVSAAEPAAAR